MFFEPVDDILVSTSSSPGEALKMILGGEFDCVVADYRMQGIDGIELVKKIRQKSNVPIIIHSMFDDVRIVDSAMSAGANKFISKTSDIASFRRLADEIRKQTRK